MTQQEIENFNTLCAEYLGYQILHKEYQYKYYSSSNEKSWVEDRGFIVCDQDGYEVNLIDNDNPLFNLHDIPFYSDWNWIMDVVHKIELTHYVTISTQNCIIQTPEQYVKGGYLIKEVGSPKLKITAEAIYRFLNL